MNQWCYAVYPSLRILQGINTIYQQYQLVQVMELLPIAFMQAKSYCSCCTSAHSTQDKLPHVADRILIVALPRALPTKTLIRSFKGLVCALDVDRDARGSVAFGAGEGQS
jgi:hypothetical protein